MSPNYFKNLPPEELQAISRKGATSRRSEALEDAWKCQNLLRQLYNEDPELHSVRALAERYEVNLRTMYRIIRGK